MRTTDKLSTCVKHCQKLVLNFVLEFGQELGLGWFVFCSSPILSSNSY